jgi:hypothetical protein
MSIPLYGQNKAGDLLGKAVTNNGFKEITVITAGDASHTLDATDGGIILISAALASGAVIKLPRATSATIGLWYKLLYTGTMAAASQIDLPDAGSAVFVGCITQNRCGNGAGVAAQAEKSIELDENDVTFGGAIGTNLEFLYCSSDVVFVTGNVHVNAATTALDGLQATMFTGTGWS